MSNDTMNKAELSAKILESNIEKINMMTRTEEYLRFICKQLAIIVDRLNTL